LVVATLAAKMHVDPKEIHERWSARSKSLMMAYYAYQAELEKKAVEETSRKKP